MENQYKLVRYNLNGKDVEQMVDVRASLTDMLRNDYRMTSVKKGCEVGECGACTVLIDGEAFNSCIYLAVWANGKKIRTAPLSSLYKARIIASTLKEWIERGEFTLTEPVRPMPSVSSVGSLKVVEVDQ